MFTCGAWVFTCGAIASTAGVGLSLPPVAPADVPAIPTQELGHLPAVLQTITSGGAEMFTCGALGCLPTVFRPRGAVFTCGADIYLRCFGMFTSGGAEMFMPDGMGCIPPVVSPTLGGSKFEYTSGGSCGRACIIPPKIGTFTCGATWTITCGAETRLPSGGCIPAVRLFIY